MPRIPASLALVLVAVLTAPPAHAEEPRAPQQKPYATVTLVTGDKVQLTKAPNGRVNVLPRPAKGRERLVFGVRQHGKTIEVYPSDAVSLVAQGRVDRRLFDVAGLVEQGYDDARTTRLPVIVQGGTGRKGLTSIGASATKVDTRSATFWRHVTSQKGTKLWLDGRVRASLDKSAAQVNAPLGWKRGFTGKGVRVAVLDTGIDESHPDLKGAVVARRSFVEAGTTADGNGHGTHVASIITGSGAKSGGRFQGIAPDAQLANGKVLDDDGYGYESDIIAGMEWATREVKARVVNVSIGGTPSDGTDPMSQAVNRLTASTGALFVVGAGNTYDRASINAPGAADQALTVGAANRHRTTADFSSKGPRPGVFLQKPDLVAPGVGIAAARAAGTDLGDNLNAFYARLSGTSMATPHVAGAAAVLAQRSPRWKAAALKSALVSTVGAPSGHPWDQGAGFLDVDRALAAKAWSLDDNVTVYAKWPHTRIIRQSVRYANRSTRPLTLSLSLQVDKGAFAAVPRTITVPAKGVAAVPIAFDPRKAKPDTYVAGHLTATGKDGTTIRTAVSAFVEFEAYDVTFEYVDRDGRTLTTFDQFAQVPTVLDPRTGRSWTPRFVDGRLVVRLPAGVTYSVTENLVTPGHDDVAPSVTTVSQPAFTAAAGRTIRLDARKANPVEIRHDRPYRERDYWAMDVMEAIPDDQWRTAAMGVHVPPDAYVLGTAPVRGRAYQFTFFQAALAGDRTYEVAVATSQRLPTTPTYRVRDRDLADVTVDIASGGVAYQEGELDAGVAYQANGMRFSYEYVRNVGMPSTRRHLLTTRVQGGTVRWYSLLLGLGEDGLPSYSEGREPEAFDPGQHVRRDYLHAAFVPSAEGSHFASGFMIANVHPVGSAVNPVGVDYAAVTGKASLLRDGVQVATANELVLNVFDLKGTATYVLRATSEHRLPWLRYATRTRGEWTFRATAPTGEDGARLPMLTPRVSGGFDGWGYAAAGLRLPLTVDIGGEGTGTVREPEVWISYDDGATWRTLTVQPAGGGWRVTPKLPATSGYGTLRIRASDDRGNSVDLTSYRAFGFKPGDRFRTLPGVDHRPLKET